jgi:hypothetical protein
VVFRRRKAAAGDPAAEEATPEAGPEPRAEGEAGAAAGAPAAADEASGAPAARRDGPWDASEVELDEVRSGPGVLDLGGLLLRPGGTDVQVQLQIDQASGTVTTVLLLWRDAGLQLVAVAAPRSRSHWPELRAALRADAQRRGARVSEATGPFGTELRIVLPVTTPDGRTVGQPSRVIGIDGPRWLVRADFLGRAAVEPAPFERLLAALRETVVVRGGEPMAPGDRIPLTMPTQPGTEPAANAPADAADAAPTLDELDPGPTITEIR